MEFSIKLDTNKAGWSIVYNEVLQVISKYYISFSEDRFVLANSAVSDEMSVYFQCLP